MIKFKANKIAKMMKPGIHSGIWGNQYAIVALIVIGIVLVVIGYETPSGHASVMNLVDYGGLFPKGLGGFLMSFQMVTFGFIGIEMIGVTASITC